MKDNVTDMNKALLKRITEAVANIKVDEEEIIRIASKLKEVESKRHIQDYFVENGNMIDDHTDKDNSDKENEP
ncbi:hypothetical protein [Ferrimonas aestuarii]|uniref:Uncharacterized protein n=1 Tax=Ferrimonas aestuarii TaxID=2569539 RepID=A0A4U1BRQ6_9GAMM|nr:hypothetical protein [Ferrimonas aestuarii]TKB58357.1 hypothetical protein FCL42_01000 [Ferrimonas aestuarii]